MKLMYRIAAVSLVSTLTVPAMAEENKPIALPVVQTADLSYAFGDSQNLQVKEMTLQEMQETEGAWLPYVGAGLVGGYFGYMGYVSSVPSSQRTWSGIATAVGSGAIGSALTLTPIGVSRAAFLGGSIGFIGNQAAISSSRK